jgi:hypothetical protein
MRSFIQVNGLTRRSEIRIIIGEHAFVFFKRIPHASDPLIWINAFERGVAMGESSQILCGKCNVLVKFWTKDDSERWGACSVCGQEDGLDAILREVAGYKIDKSLPAGFFSGTTVGSGSITIKSQPKRQYRWVVAD